MFNAQCTWVQKEAKKSFREEREKIQNHFSNNEKKTRSWKSFLQPLEEEERKVRRIHQSSDLRREGEKNLSPILRGEWGAEYFFSDCFWPLPSFTNPALMQQVSIVRGWAVLPELLSLSNHHHHRHPQSHYLFYFSHGHGDQNTLYTYSVLLPGGNANHRWYLSMSSLPAAV